MPLILPGNVATALGGAYEVANSCRFNNDDSAYMTKTYGSVGNQKTFTISLWTKRSELSTIIPSGQNFISYYYSSTTARSDLGWSDDDRIIIGLNPTGSSWAYYYSTGKFRDPSAWYHICIAFDTTQGTDSNRLKLWVNNRQETITGGYPAENLDTGYNANGYVHQIGKYASGDAAYLDGYLAEFVVLDGTATTPSSFGEYDEDSPTIWKPIDVSGLTFGTNGFYLDFEDSGDLDDDESGNTNDFTATNLAATDQATDTPTNNFATWNSVMPALSNTSFSEGNLTFASNGSASGQLAAISTMAASTGKWYAEFKMTDESTQAGSYPYIGTVGTSLFASTYIGASGLDGVGFNSNEAVYSNGSEIDSGVTNIAAGNIVGVAADFTNKKIYFHVNGTYINSGDPAAGSNGYTIPTTAESFYSFMCSVYGASGTWEANFGSPSFSISSGNADGNGYGNFEYAVPSGYLALCTKNLGSDGG